MTDPCPAISRQTSMKFLGLLGAGNLDPITRYGRRLVTEVRHRYGHGGEIKLATLDLHLPELSEALSKQEWGRAGELLGPGAAQLVALGVDAIVPCSSRLQQVIKRLVVPVPLLPMAEAVGRALQTLRIKRIGLVGAATETEEIYWRKQLARYQVLDVFVPVLRDREHLACLSMEELQLGIVNQATRSDVGRIIYSLRQAGARAIVLVAPEFSLALSHLDPVLPVLDAEELHALFALEWSLRSPPTSPSPASPTHSREKRPRKSATTQA